MCLLFTIGKVYWAVQFARSRLLCFLSKRSINIRFLETAHLPMRFKLTMVLYIFLLVNFCWPYILVPWRSLNKNNITEIRNLTFKGLRYVKDMSKAFDSVEHQILLRKIQSVGASTSALKWFNSYLTNRYQVVRIHSSVSDPLPVECGVPQGSILGPLS